MKKLYGVTTAMVTPFHKNGTVDLKAVEELTEFLISKGVHCLYPLGTTGEMLKLSVSERKAIAETVVKTANKRVTVYIHVGDIVFDNVIELAKHAHTIGADGIGAVTPVYFGVNEREMEHYYVELSKSLPGDFPVYLYSIPQCASNELPVDVVEKIVEKCKNVVGLKYSFPDFTLTSKYLNVNNGDFDVVFGPDHLFLPALALGCTGTVSGVSSVYPEPFVALYEAYEEGNIEKARELQRIATKYCDALKNGSNMSYFKEALKMRGLNGGYMKAPHLDITENEMADLKMKLGEIEKEVHVIVEQ
ncbi:dihydrodipicolinate synthase family protein [Halalkalibacter hemicellulosilyticus]|uniref:Dihydrodipicolinate synthase n=1 Tax=Halalkalibacter hemicellulosilyticusJCM 9152 TaxID=1236971 RepID=W4QKC2_9BACI|nr:dihydrodipicolinate synthase family protein [Halalkalibacter hemicellulosilyticus]GAE31799.1 dihydrodipicolinate synthase [Halalkalibacter hemicellulosilyticusJCM 9152]